MVDMSNRLIDVFGDQQASLVPALGGLFDSFRDLSLDASSEVRRDQVLGSAQSLAARFNDLSAQLDAFDVESSEALEAKVGELNVLLERLGQINGKLQKTEEDPAQQPRPVGRPAPTRCYGISLGSRRLRLRSNYRANVRGK